MRYEAIESSELGHDCCFHATVIDTHNQSKVVCECFDLETAKMIADALNKVEK